MKFATLTLNPAVDQTVMVNRLLLNAVNRGREMRFEAGGKGVNVAAFLASYGLSVAATGFLGQENGKIFEEMFARLRIEDRFIRIPGLTRTSVKIVDEAARQTTDINMPGLSPTLADIDRLMHEMEYLAMDCDTFVLTGSVPPDVSPDIYATMMKALHKRGARIVLDTSGSALMEGIYALPEVIKPNRSELEALLGAPLPTEAHILSTARKMLAKGIQTVIVSLGSKGALFAWPDVAYMAVPPAVAVLSTVGAGDALVAGYLAACAKGMDMAGSARLATAFAIAAITTSSRLLPPPHILDEYAARVTIRRID